jgi:hypothetical protein
MTRQRRRSTCVHCIGALALSVCYTMRAGNADIVAMPSQALEYNRAHATLARARAIHIPYFPLRSFLTRLLLGVLLERVRRVGAQSALGVILVVDVGCGGAGLGVGLGLRLGRLTACVRSGHDDSTSALEDAQESGEGRRGRWRRTIGRGVGICCRSDRHCQR